MEFDLGPDLRHPTSPEDTDVLEYVLPIAAKAHPHGYAVEFGVGSGQTLWWISQHLSVIGFDSFEGLPEDWRDEYPKGSFKFDHPGDIDNATIVTGMFHKTAMDYDFPVNLALVHFDADLYSSTLYALESVGDRIEPGTILVFDEFFGYEGCEEHEQRAWFEYAERWGYTWEVIGHGREQWAIRITGVGEHA